MSDINYDKSIWDTKTLPNKIKPDEDIIMVAREDLIIIFGKALMLFVVFFVLLVLRILVLGSLDSLAVSLFDSLIFGVNVILITIFTLIFHNYYLSIQIVTSERLIDIDQRGLFNREMNTLPIENIEDVTFKQNGFFGTVFNYGNVIVQTAGEESVTKEAKTSGFVFNNVPQPSAISAKLIKLFQNNQTQKVHFTAKTNAEAIKQALHKDQVM